MSTSDDRRHRAREGAQQLVDALGAEPDHDGKRSALVEAEHLQRAIQAFHMEAVRFRCYTLGRMLGQADAPFSERSRAAFLELKNTLEALGLPTR